MMFFDLLTTNRTDLKVDVIKRLSINNRMFPALYYCAVDQLFNNAGDKVFDEDRFTAVFSLRQLVF